MKNTNPLVTACALLAITFLTGCSSGPARYSGYLSSYSGLRDAERVEGAKVYENPKFSFGKYDKFMIRPVGVQFDPAEELVIDAEALKEITTYFNQKLVTELSKNYKVVTQPGPGTLDLRIALVHLKKTQPLFNIHPAMKLSGIGLGGASIEAEAIDAATGVRQFTFIHTTTGSRLGLVEGFQDWAHSKEAIDFWVKTLVERLNEAHGIVETK